MIVSIRLAVFLSGRMQRVITDPILKLAETARIVGEMKDYSVRASVESRGDELGRLTESFNAMLSRVQSQDAALSLSQKKMEALIHSIDGIVWECEPETLRFTFVSRQVERLLGYAPEDWLSNPQFWQEKLHPEDAAKVIQACHEMVARRRPFSREYRLRAADGRTVWIRQSGVVLIESGLPVAVRGIFLDITEHKEAAGQLELLNRRLVETSRQAGMAEVATGVLHNVGNVLNSVSVSATLVSDRLKRSKLTNLRRATAMLREQNGDLAQFLTTDPKGKVLPEYLCTASDQLASEQSDMLDEVVLLSQNIDHIKEIVAMQQSYAKVSGAFEHLDPTELIEDALRMNAAAFDRHRVQVVREYDAHLPRVFVDRHKVLQILINLIRNAKYALDAGNPVSRRLVVRAEATADGMVAIRVCDNGVGIAPDNLVRIFGHGFTTKKDGHGFGLHSGANAAKEMGGSLSARSDGPGKGAEFTLELPVKKTEGAMAA
jgi:PAS domain S-box-containing protein